MEHQLWMKIVAVLKAVDKPRHDPRCRYRCEDIVLVWFWAVVHDRPVSWACERRNWPLHLRRRPVPSQSRMSVRLRTPEVQSLIRAIEERTLRPKGSKPIVWVIDGKPLVIGGASKDRQAGVGRAARGKAKGYKLHKLMGLDGSVAAWRIAPMNKDERIMARRLLRQADIQGYVLGDGNYDSNALHEIASRRGNLQMVTPPRGGCGRTNRRRYYQDPGRLRSIELLESPTSQFGRTMLRERNAIERKFGNLSNWGGGLTHLPPWIRTHPRVYAWVQAKLIIDALKRPPAITTYVN
jgi:hypothetical protein